MKGWSCRAFERRSDANVYIEEMQHVMLQGLQAEWKSTSAAAFAHFDLERGSVVVYFSPAAAAFAKFYHAEPCERPERQGLALLIGPEHCWDYLFTGG